MAAIVAIEKFFEKHLNGRFQVEVSDEVAKRLELITVDVSTVEVPEEM
jgi:hypothetical protein